MLAALSNLLHYCTLSPPADWTLLSPSSKDVSLFTVYPADEIRRYWFRSTKKNAAKICLTYKSQGKSREKQPYIFTPLRRLEALLKHKILVLINGRENNISPQPFHQPALLETSLLFKKNATVSFTRQTAFGAMNQSWWESENAEISLRGLEAHNGDYLFRNSYELKKNYEVWGILYRLVQINSFRNYTLLMDMCLCVSS